ncbi:MAG TPA: hypothetical protein VFV49_14320 [Thermoanaerobaculia bacterium]|nr:hypothetical protein [Thermoanaerobaculia bacterium]
MKERQETVNQHPDSDTLLAFRDHRLSGAVVAEVARHIGGCTQCAKAEPGADRRALAALVLDHHLSDEELDLLIDEQADDPAYRAISLHAATCAMCRAEVDDLRRFDAAPPAEPSSQRWRPSQRWLIAATIAFTVVALSAIALLLRRTTPDITPVTASNPPAPVEPGPVTPPAPRVVASLADGTGRIALLEDGTIAGVELRTPRDAEDARAVLSGRSIAIPTFIAAMPGAVRGGDAGAHPLRAIEPFRSAVLEARPRFSWTPVRDASSYRVAVFDADYEEIARSEALQGTSGTSWTPSKPLPAGVDFSWHVVAETPAGEISSAGSDRAEAVFRVLTPKEGAEVDLGEAHYGGSHLLRGLLYSRHGLLHDAEREFRRLAEQNPGSPVARALIDSVSR